MSKPKVGIILCRLARNLVTSSHAGVFVSALQFAADEGNMSLVQQLLDRNAAIDTKGDDVLLSLENEAEGASGGSHGLALGAACFSGHEDVARLLLDHGADLTATNDYNSTPLHLAASHGHGAVVQLLLERGADVTVTNKSNDTPLHDAARNGDAGAVQVLLDRGANIRAINRSNDTPLHTAAYYGCGAIVQLLLR
jgi:ankyrin repeat protein